MAKTDRSAARRFILAAVVVAAGAMALGLRRGRSGPAGAQAAAVGRAMARPLPAVRWRGATLPRAIDDLERLAGVRIDVRWDALRAAHAALDDPAIEADLRGVSCGAALDAALGQVKAAEPLRRTFRRGVPTVSTESDLDRDLIVRAYDAADLVDRRYWPYTLAEWDRSVKARELAAYLAPPPPTNLCFRAAPIAPARTPAEEAARRASELASLVSDDWNSGTATGFDGRLVVLAPEEIHRTFQRLFGDLRASGDAGAPAPLSLSTSEPAASDAGLGGEAAPARPAPPAARADEQLARIIPELDLRGVSLGQAFDRLRDLTKANLVVEWQGLGDAGLDKGTKVGVRLWNVKLGQALDTLLAELGGDTVRLGYAAEDGVITITTHERLAARTELRIYDVREIILRMRESDQGLGVTTPREIGEYADDLASGLRDFVDPDSWRDNGGVTGSVRYWSGRLVIQQTHANHLLIEQTLDQARTEFARPIRSPATRPAGGAASRPTVGEGK